MEALSAIILLLGATAATIFIFETSVKWFLFKEKAHKTNYKKLYKKHDKFIKTNKLGYSGTVNALNQNNTRRIAEALEALVIQSKAENTNQNTEQ